MLGWALFFFIIAIIAAALGFGGIAGAAVGIAKILFSVHRFIYYFPCSWSKGPSSASLRDCDLINRSFI